jgi:hypothetical protein
MEINEPVSPKLRLYGENTLTNPIHLGYTPSMSD